MFIPLISDKTHDIVKKYGVLFKEKGLSYRAVCVIDGDGKLRQFSISEPTVFGSVEEVLRVVKAFQFHKLHGAVCPANWAPGKSGIEVGLETSKKFFEKLD